MKHFVTLLVALVMTAVTMQAQHIERRCSTCGKTLSACPYKGKHNKKQPARTAAARPAKTAASRPAKNSRPAKTSAARPARTRTNSSNTYSADVDSVASDPVETLHPAAAASTPALGTNDPTGMYSPATAADTKLLLNMLSKPYCTVDNASTSLTRSKVRSALKKAGYSIQSFNESGDNSSASIILYASDGFSYKYAGVPCYYAGAYFSNDRLNNYYYQFYLREDKGFSKEKAALLFEMMCQALKLTEPASGGHLRSSSAERYAEKEFSDAWVILNLTYAPKYGSRDLELDIRFK